MSEADGQDDAGVGGSTAGLLSRLAELGFDVEVAGERITRLRQERKADPGNAQKIGSRAHYAHHLPSSVLPTLTEQLSGEVTSLPDHFGHVIASTGWFEVLLAPGDPAPARALDRLMRNSADAASLECRHSGAGCMPMICIDSEMIAGSLLATRGGRVHVSDAASEACLEISAASPAGVLFGPPNAGPMRFADRLSGFGAPVSLKIDFGVADSAQAILDRGIAVMNSFLFELAIRNGVFLETLRRSFYERERVRPFGSSHDLPRFPSTVVKDDVAELFSFAESARANPPLAFLSYYQVLEYFFPFAMRRVAIRGVRREVIDPRFDVSSDAAILKILATAETTANASEATQLRTLVSSSVRGDLLEEFLAEERLARHFTKAGPITGVGHINIRDQGRTLHEQFADRVYAIRNRIVHAKDDPKYSEVRVLLPQSREAFALGPDVALVRLLAAEVIIDSQLA